MKYALEVILGHSFCNQLLAVPTRGSISPSNIAGFIFNVFEESPKSPKIAVVDDPTVI